MTIRTQENILSVNILTGPYISRTIWRGPNILMDILTGADFKDLLVWAKCLHRHFGQDQMSCKGDGIFY